MQLKDSRNKYYYYSERTSNIGRYIAFAGFAIIWSLKSEFSINDIHEWPIHAIWLLTITIILDLLQYVTGTMVWAIYSRRKEKELDFDENKEFFVPNRINWPTLTFFWLKIVFLFSAYIYLFFSVLRLPSLV